MLLSVLNATPLVIVAVVQLGPSEVSTLASGSLIKQLVHARSTLTTSLALLQQRAVVLESLTTSIGADDGLANTAFEHMSTACVGLETARGNLRISRSLLLYNLLESTGT